MAWLAVDKRGNETISPEKPKREPSTETYCKKTHKWLLDNSKSYYWAYVETINMSYESNLTIYLPKGSIEKLIGKTLTWEDKPIEI